VGDGNPAGLGGGGWSGVAHPSKRPLSPATYGGQLIGGRVTSTARKENGVGLVHVGLVGWWLINNNNVYWLDGESGRRKLRREASIRQVDQDSGRDMYAKRTSNRAAC
jgi:hypothetical protein